MKALVCCGIMLSTVLLCSATNAESLYRCSDGSFTNKAERQCPLYEPKGIVQVQPKPNGEQPSEVKASEVKPPFASVTLFKEPTKKHSKGE